MISDKVRDTLVVQSSDRAVGRVSEREIFERRGSHLSDM